MNYGNGAAQGAAIGYMQQADERAQAKSLRPVGSLGVSVQGLKEALARVGALTARLGSEADRVMGPLPPIPATLNGIDKVGDVGQAAEISDLVSRLHTSLAALESQVDRFGAL